MYKFTGPAARAALVAGLVSVLGTGYAAYATDHPAPASPSSTSAPHSDATPDKGSSPGTAPEAPPQQHYAHAAIAQKWAELGYGYDSTEEDGSGPETPWSPAPSGTPPKHTPTPTPTVKPTWGEDTWGEQTPPVSTPPTGTPTSPPGAWTPTPTPTSPPGSWTPTPTPTSPPGTWTPTPTPTYPTPTATSPTTTPTYPTPTPPQQTTPGTPGTSPSPPSPPHLAHTGAGSKASLLGALSAGAVVTGAAAVALTRRASRSKCEK
ncbi:hypothetical protein ACIBCO_32525 [Streptomyces violascens]|uniref:hypothetical protein n=1 Tax=Streptomyces violascens TaxID=67381 RepID=UPI0037B0D651